MSLLYLRGYQKLRNCLCFPEIAVTGLSIFPLYSTSGLPVPSWHGIDGGGDASGGGSDGGGGADAPGHNHQFLFLTSLETKPSW